MGQAQIDTIPFTVSVGRNRTIDVLADRYSYPLRNATDLFAG